MDPAQIEGLTKAVENLGVVGSIVVTTWFFWNVVKTVHGWWQKAQEKKNDKTRQPMDDDPRKYDALVVEQLRCVKQDVKGLIANNGAIVAHIETLTKSIENAGELWRESARENSQTLNNINTTLVAMQGEINRVREDVHDMNIRSQI